MDYLGSANTNVELACTEHGTGGDRQPVSLVGGLFWADSIGQILQTEFNSRLGGTCATGNRHRRFRQRALRLAHRLVHECRPAHQHRAILLRRGHRGWPGKPATNRYPTFYCGKLMKYFARGGDTVVTATNDYQLLSAYAVRRTNGA